MIACLTKAPAQPRVVPALLMRGTSKLLGLSDLIVKFTVAPARLLSLAKGTLSIGADADGTAFDLNHDCVFDKSPSATKSGTRPPNAWDLKAPRIVGLDCQIHRGPRPPPQPGQRHVEHRRGC